MTLTMHRAPAVAGMFYPGDPQALATCVGDFLQEAAPAETSPLEAPKALIVPHAGYQYSGSVAASGYRLLQKAANRISRVVLLGPAHRVYLQGMAVPEATAFDFPGGCVPLDVDAVAAIRRLPGVIVSDEAHADEHCLEVHLPFLDATLAEFRLVPIVVGACPSKQVADVLNLLWGGDETLIVVSSDLSHFLPYEAALRMDEQTSQAITTLTTSLHGEQACGAHAINGLWRLPDSGR